MAGYIFKWVGDIEVARALQRIAFVDENKELVNIMVEFFSSSGYHAVSLSGPDLVKKLDSLKPSLILLDLGMKNTNGETIFQDIMNDKYLHDVPVIVTSSFIDSIDTSIISRARGMIEKPFSLNTLLNHVNRCLANS